MLPLTPTKLGRYEILDEIGKGAMGVVYLARDPLIGRLVALKTFRIGFSLRDQEADQFRARFIREAQSAGILSHPNIVTIHDVVELAGDGLSFIAMEYVRGSNLKMALQGDQPLPLARVADIISQVGEALDYAHSQRVIHRDVKPANIILTEDGRVKITDFGIARLDTSNLTQEGQLLGTPNYMAPEQVQGKEVDHRADIFALGVVLYEMLTRHKPFQGENLTVVSHRIVYDQFTPLREYARHVPPGVEKIISRALEKDPNRRYQRARELAEDLRKLVAEAAGGDELNETQSLSSTMVIPPDSRPVLTGSPTTPSTSSPSTVAPAPGPAAAPARKPLWSRLFGGGAGARAVQPVSLPPPAPAPAIAAAPDLLSGTGSGSQLSGSGSQPAVPVIVPPPPLAPAAPGEPMASETGDGSASGTGTGMPSATGSSLSLPPLPPMPAAVPVSRPVPVPAGGRRSARRPVLLGAGIAAVLLLGVLLLWWAARMRASEPVAPPAIVAPPQTPTPAAVQDVATLVAQGNALLRKGEWAQAAETYAKAEQQAQDQELTDVTRLREGAQKLQADFPGMVGEEQGVEARLAQARTALRLRRYADAIAAAKFVLASRPKDLETARILKRAQEGESQERAAQLAAGGESESAPSAESSPTATPSEAESAAAVPQTGRLHLSLHIDAPVADGTVRVLKDTRELWKQSFNVGKGLLGRRRGVRQFEAGGIEVPAGENQITIFYAPRDVKEEGDKWVMTVNVPGGATRRADIRITASKKLYAVGQSN